MCGWSVKQGKIIFHTARCEREDDYIGRESRPFSKSVARQKVHWPWRTDPRNSATHQRFAGSRSRHLLPASTHGCCRGDTASTTSLSRYGCPRRLQWLGRKKGTWVLLRPPWMLTRPPRACWRPRRHHLSFAALSMPELGNYQCLSRMLCSMGRPSRCGRLLGRRRCRRSPPTPLPPPPSPPPPSPPPPLTFPQSAGRAHIRSSSARLPASAA